MHKKIVEIDADEIESLSHSCGYMLRIIGALKFGLPALRPPLRKSFADAFEDMTARLQVLARWLNVMHFRVEFAKEVDEYED